MNKKIAIPCAIFLAIQAALYYFMLFDSRGYFNEIAFSFIVLNCLFALAFMSFRKNSALINAGLAFTVIADYFLVLSQPTDQSLGMVAFSCAQTCYAAYLFFVERNRKVRIAGLITRIATVVVVEIVAALVLGDKIDLVSVLSVYYIVNLAASIIFAFLLGKSGLLFAIGLCLFIMCDLFVGFSSAAGVYLDIPTTSLLYKIVFADFNFIWFFYAPSQVMIALNIPIKNYGLKN
ncbi:MAG: hypothetical protein IKC48_05170 [Clostridia bacterium]|nr:hypothetical protein [Clostridia bacterium]